jgi:hypothetical protein
MERLKSTLTVNMWIDQSEQMVSWGIERGFCWLPVTMGRGGGRGGEKTPISSYQPVCEPVKRDEEKGDGGCHLLLYSYASVLYIYSCLQLSRERGQAAYMHARTNEPF